MRSAGKLSAIGAESRGYLVVNPNASDLMIERRWPSERFAVMIDRLVEQHGLPVVLIGAPADRSHVVTVADQVRVNGDRVFNLAGQLSLGGLFALLEGAACMITNDTGPMHMAWALETPTVCLFGPVDPQHYAWQGSGVEVLYKRSTVVPACTRSTSRLAMAIMFA